MSQFFLVLQDAWRWWLGEFLSLPPVARLQRLAKPRRRLLTLLPAETFTGVKIVVGDQTVETDQLTFPETEDQVKRVKALLSASFGKRRLQVVGLIPNDQVLSRQLNLPLATERHLRDAIRYQLERISPFPEADAMFDGRVVLRNRAENLLRAEVRILKRSIIEDIEERAARIGLTVDAFAMQGADGTLHILDLQSRSAAGKRFAMEDKALYAAAAVLAASLILAPFLKEIWAAQAFAGQAAALKPKADQAMKLQKERDKLLASRAEVIGMKMASAPPLRILAKLSELLDDNAYLLEYRSEGSAVTVSGFAGDASKLIQTLETAPELKAVRFSGPVARDPQTGRDRFTLTIDTGTAR